MVDSTKTALQLLEELRRERDDLIATVQMLEKRLGITSSSVQSESDMPPAASRVPISTDAIPVGFFHNLSQAAAAEKLLRMNPNTALTTGEILDAFRRSGADTHNKNALTILYTALKRSPKFERVAGKAWGLSEWYPEKRKKKEIEESESESESND